MVYERSLQRERAQGGVQGGGRWVEALLDNIRSAWNVGSMFRTADGVGIRKLHLCGYTSLPDNPKVVKTSLGAEAHVLWEYTPDGVAAARALKGQGCLLWALEDEPRSIPLWDAPEVDIHQRVVLVVGNEVCGIDEGILEVCDLSLHIPMRGVKKSYNAAVAFGIAAYQLCYT
ncbi:MAG: TrmH family RNA methyltransferase [Chloroflexi bacterium]|nr:TrmH family RNA methyltransferase [Chloroflexota bacterium]